MFRSVIVAIAMAGLVAVGGCGVPTMTANPERSAEARVLLEDLATGRDQVLMGKMAPQVDPAQLRAQLPFMKSLVPAGPLPEAKTVGWRANAGTGGMTYELTQTYDYPDRTLTVNTAFIKQGEAWKVAGFYVAPTMKAGAPQPEPNAATPVEVRAG